MKKFYLVGGAPRDYLLGLQPKDYDFVVVGASPDDFKEWQCVGKDFPVFLEPTRGWEVALGRIERKVGAGYTGFESDWKGVTLEEDLARRDLTINSIAIEVDWEETVLQGKPVTIGTWIDPFSGIEDIKNKILRPTTTAFKEDPIRLLRAARFMARYGDTWSISGELLKMMDDIYYSGEMRFLVAERVFLEMQKALTEKYPSLFFKTLFRYNIFKQIDWVYGVPQREDHHPEKEDYLEKLW